MRHAPRSGLPDSSATFFLKRDGVRPAFHLRRRSAIRDGYRVRARCCARPDCSKYVPRVVLPAAQAVLSGVENGDLDGEIPGFRNDRGRDVRQRTIVRYLPPRFHRLCGLVEIAFASKRAKFSSPLVCSKMTAKSSSSNSRPLPGLLGRGWSGKVPFDFSFAVLLQPLPTFGRQSIFLGRTVWRVGLRHFKQPLFQRGLQIGFTQIFSGFQAQGMQNLPAIHFAAHDMFGDWTCEHRGGRM
jgi:hypothetical protein